jgi:hypothetical protein
LLRYVRDVDLDIKPAGLASGFGYSACEYSLISPSRIERRWTLVAVKEEAEGCQLVARAVSCTDAVVAG